MYFYICSLLYHKYFIALSLNFMLVPFHEWPHKLNIILWINLMDKVAFNKQQYVYDAIPCFFLEANSFEINLWK